MSTDIPKSDGSSKSGTVTLQAADPADPRGLIDRAVANHRRRTLTPAIETAPNGSPMATAHQASSVSGLLFGVFYPAAVILIEATTGLCAKHLFDPMPTFWHGALLAMVPLANLLTWLWLAGTKRRRPRLHAALNGFATAIAAFYAILFLPILPLALVAILVGLGLLPFGPLVACLAALKMRRCLAAAMHQSGGFKRANWTGVALAVLALLGLDAPHAVTRHGLSLAGAPRAEDRAQGIALLRTFGSHSVLLGLCYDNSSHPVGPISFLLAATAHGLFDAQRRSIVPQQQAREVYYRVTGRPFNTQPAPAPRHRRAAFGARPLDQDRGGAHVGGRVPGLILAASRIDGTIAADDAVAYVEWLFEVANDGDMVGEARMTIALPPGGVVSRVTLWVNGVEEEAAFAGRAQVRQAYERVVRRSQDPFLVTTKGADRVLAQAFPVAQHGGIMKFKIGITVPLEIEGGDKTRLVLPAIIDRNFSLHDGMRHAIWIESRRPLATASAELAVSEIAGGARIAGGILDAALTGARPIILADRDPQRRLVHADNPETGGAVQEFLATFVPADRALMLVVDGSALTKPHVAAILKALEALPDGLPVGLAIASEGGRVTAPEPWSLNLMSQFAARLQTEPYQGGVDNTPALLAALARVGGAPGGRVLWIHGPQPVAFAASRPLHDQIVDRQRHTPALSLYALEPGPNELLRDASWTAAARDIPSTGDVTADLTRALRRFSGLDPIPDARRTLLADPGLPSEPNIVAPRLVAPSGSQHIVRLAASDEVAALIRRNTPATREAAVKLAGLHRLVTPVSGAVVLETQQQYRDAGLVQGIKGQKGNVPTVPEPHEWALILMVAMALGWLLWSRKFASTSRPGTA